MAKKFENPYAQFAAPARKSTPTRPVYDYEKDSAGAGERKAAPARVSYNTQTPFAAVPPARPPQTTAPPPVHREPQSVQGAHSAPKPSRVQPAQAPRSAPYASAQDFEPIAAATPRGRASRTQQAPQRDLRPPVRPSAAQKPTPPQTPPSAARRPEGRRETKPTKKRRAPLLARLFRPKPKTEEPPRQISYKDARRQKRYRRIMMLSGAVVALLVGFVLSVTVLFKIETIEVEFTADAPYAPEQLIALLGFEKGDNLFRFSSEKTEATLTQALAYIEEVTIRRRLPGTVKLTATPAVERYVVNSDFGWAVLSESLKVLRVEIEQPAGLMLLQGVQANAPVAGSSVVFQGDAAAQEAVRTTLRQLTRALTQQEIIGVSEIDLSTQLELSFLYEGRVRVLLGTTNELETKIEWVKYLLEESGQISDAEQGTLDASGRNEEGRLEGVWRVGKL